MKRSPKGCYKCAQCKLCDFVQVEKTFTSAHTGESYQIKDFINRKSTGLIYKITCSCPRDYIGKTSREFCRRIGEHLGNIRRGDDTPVAMHIREYHDGLMEAIQFKGLELVKPTMRGG